MIDALNRALTAYTDCLEDQDAHTLAAARFFEIAYGEVLGSQRALVKRLTFGARSGGLSPELLDDWRTPEGFVKRIREGLGLPEHWYSDNLTSVMMHGSDSRFAQLVRTGARIEADQARQITGSLTGRTTRPKPELQDYRQRPPSPEYGMYECKRVPVFDDIPATHEIADPKPREWSGPDEPTRVDFRVSAATVLSLGGGS